VKLETKSLKKTFKFKGDETQPKLLTGEQREELKNSLLVGVCLHRVAYSLPREYSMNSPEKGKWMMILKFQGDDLLHLIQALYATCQEILSTEKRPKPSLLIDKFWEETGVRLPKNLRNQVSKAQINLSHLREFAFFLVFSYESSMYLFSELDAIINTESLSAEGPPLFDSLCSSPQPHELELGIKALQGIARVILRKESKELMKREPHKKIRDVLDLQLREFENGKIKLDTLCPRDINCSQAGAFLRELFRASARLKFSITENKIRPYDELVPMVSVLEEPEPEMEKEYIEVNQGKTLESKPLETSAQPEKGKQMEIDREREREIEMEREDIDMREEEMMGSYDYMEVDKRRTFSSSLPNPKNGAEESQGAERFTSLSSEQSHDFSSRKRPRGTEDGSVPSKRKKGLIFFLRSI